MLKEDASSAALREVLRLAAEIERHAAEVMMLMVSGISVNCTVELPNS